MAQERLKRKKQFLQKPTYVGGTDALNKFIEQNLDYPLEAQQKGIQGSVHVKYDVNENGDVEKAEVTRGIGYGCDEEALRLVKKLKFQAVRNRGTHVTSHFDIVIRFQLSKLHVPNSPLTLQYNFIADTSEQSYPLQVMVGGLQFAFSVTNLPVEFLYQIES